MRSVWSSSLLDAGQLRLGLEPVGELVDRFTSMRNSVLLDFGHLGECLAFILEADVPCWILSVRLAIPWKRSGREMYRNLSSHVQAQFCPVESSAIAHQEIGRHTLVRPWKRIGSWPGPAEYANVQTASAPLFSVPASRVWKFLQPTLLVKSLLRQDGQDWAWSGREMVMYT